MYTYIHTYIHIYVHIYVRMYIIMYEGGKFFSYVQFLVKKCVKNPGYPLFPTRVFLALPVPNPNTRVKPPFPTRPVPNVNSIYPFPSRPDPSTALRQNCFSNSEGYSFCIHYQRCHDAHRAASAAIQMHSNSEYYLLYFFFFHFRRACCAVAR